MVVEAARGAQVGKQAAKGTTMVGLVVVVVVVVQEDLVGMAVAFILNKYIVFNVNGAAQAQVIRFALVNLCSLSAVWVTSVFLAEILFPYLSFNWHAEDLAHIIGVMIPAVLSYLGHKYYTFS